MKDMNISMSVPKGDIERRDLIFREIENEAMKDRENKSVNNNETPEDTGIVGQLKSIGQNLMFWKK